MKIFTLSLFQILLLSLVLFLMGCGRQHSVRVHGNSLSFTYANDSAREIFFASSIDNFQHHRATKGSGKVWHVTTSLHEEFTYFYIVDGTVTLPECPNTVLDDFGGKNCLYVHGM